MMTCLKFTVNSSRFYILVIKLMYITFYDDPADAATFDVSRIRHDAGVDPRFRYRAPAHAFRPKSPKNIQRPAHDYVKHSAYTFFS
jgi:hypothetical protein